MTKADIAGILQDVRDSDGLHILGGSPAEAVPQGKAPLLLDVLAELERVAVLQELLLLVPQQDAE